MKSFDKIFFQRTAALPAGVRQISWVNRIHWNKILPSDSHIPTCLGSVSQTQPNTPPYRTIVRYLLFRAVCVHVGSCWTEYGRNRRNRKKSLFCTVKHDHKTTFMLVFLPSGRWFWFLFRIGGGTPHSPNRNRYAEWNQSCVTTIGGLNGGSTDSAVGKRAMDG